MQRSTNPNPYLLAILLIVRSSSGINFVFHYPPKPKATPTPVNPTPRQRRYVYPISGTSSPSSPSTSCSSEDEADDRQSRTTACGGGGGGGGGGHTATERSDSGSKSRSRLHRQPDEDEGNGEKAGEPDDVGGAQVLGFKEKFLAGLLAPKERMCKTKFELTVDNMVFLGYPLHVRADGTWRKQKKKKKTKKQKQKRRQMGNGESGGRGGGNADGDDDEEVEVEDEDDSADRAINGGHEDDADDEEEEDRERSQGGAGNMTMFHVVFVLNPPELEYHSKTQEMFDHVVKRFARALKYEQAKDGYVCRESEKIVRIKDKASHEGTPFVDVWKEILDQSGLAYAISRIYSDISQSKIANVFLNNNLGLSLQMPITSEISVLPSLTEPQVPGLYDMPLTTANSLGDDETDGDSMLAKHFTLLFLEDVDSILKDIAAETTESSTLLARFVESCKPTLSFLQISNVCGVPLHEIQIMARHLVHWRKARAIPPIHQRDTYVVSPNADMKGLHKLIPIYNTLFPTLQPLPKLLSQLSGKPKSYTTFIPSRDHRPAYLEILAFLIRHGLVTQLRTFAWIRVPRSIKLAVSPDSPPDSPDSDDSIILQPHQATSLESRWLSAMTRDKPPDIKALFDRIIKYLNGQHAIEKIAVREGISRRDVKRVLGAFDGVVVYTRHW